MIFIALAIIAVGVFSVILVYRYKLIKSRQQFIIHRVGSREADAMVREYVQWASWYHGRYGHYPSKSEIIEKTIYLSHNVCIYNGWRGHWYRQLLRQYLLLELGMDWGCR